MYMEEYILNVLLELMEANGRIIKTHIYLPMKVLMVFGLIVMSGQEVLFL